MHQGSTLHHLFSLAYDQTCQALTASGFRLIATGDWAKVFRAPGSSEVVRITPYDPAYRVFLQIVRQWPNKHLPKFGDIVDLLGCGYSVSMPYYERRVSEESKDFLERVRKAMDTSSDADTSIATLVDTLRRGVEFATGCVHYFADIDWNTANVLFDGDVPIFIDAFYQDGPTITRKLEASEQLSLSSSEISEFLKIPFQRELNNVAEPQLD